MSLQGYIFGLKMSTFFALCAWALVMLYVDPESSGVMGMCLFFGTLFLWLSGAMALILTVLQSHIQDNEYAAKQLSSNIRRGTLVAMLGVIMLALQYNHILTFWSILLVGVAFLLIELHFIHKKQYSLNQASSGHTKKNARRDERRYKDNKLSHDTYGKK